MTNELKQHFTDKQGSDRPTRKKWFLEQFNDIPEVIYSLSAEDLNATWLSKFNENKNPRTELAQLQKRISRMGSARKAVVEQYIQMGEFLLDGIDFYRYNIVKNEFVADAVPGDWNGK